MIINMTDPLTIFAALAVSVLLIFLGVEIKRSIPTGIGLFAFIALIVVHSIQLVTNAELSTLFLKCISMDFIFIFLMYIAYLWVDDVEAKARNKASIDNSLDWFWKNV